MKRHARAATVSLLLLIALAAAVSGCGGGSGTAATSEARSSTAGKQAAAPGADRPGPSKAQFIAQADAICKAVNAELASVAAQSGTAAEVQRIVPRHAAIERRGLAKLTGLTPAASLARAWKSILGDRQTLIGQLGELVSDTKRKDTAAMQALTASKKKVHDRLHTTARAAGFKDCATVG